MSTVTTGTIVQCIGAVVDVEFPRDAMPHVYDALILEQDAGNKLVEQGLTFEVEQQLGDGVVRTIAMGSSSDSPTGGLRAKCANDCRCASRYCTQSGRSSGVAIALRYRDYRWGVVPQDLLPPVIPHTVIGG